MTPCPFTYISPRLYCASASPFFANGSIISNNVDSDKRKINLDEFTIKNSNKIVFINGNYSNNLSSILSDQDVFARFLNLNKHKNEQILQQYFGDIVIR